MRQRCKDTNDSVVGRIPDGSLLAHDTTRGMELLAGEGTFLPQVTPT